MNKSQWHEKNKLRIREYNTAYQRKRRKENYEHTRAVQLAWYERNRASIAAEAPAVYARKRDGILRAKYGIGVTEYDAMLAAQGNGCAICLTLVPGGPGKYFHVDHCHESGKVRGLLCCACNRLLGFARDSADVLAAAHSYIVKHG